MNFAERCPLCSQICFGSWSNLKAAYWPLIRPFIIVLGAFNLTTKRSINFDPGLRATLECQTGIDWFVWRKPAVNNYKWLIWFSDAFCVGLWIVKKQEWERSNEGVYAVKLAADTKTFKIISTIRTLNLTKSTYSQ